VKEIGPRGVRTDYPKTRFWEGTTRSFDRTDNNCRKAMLRRNALLLRLIVTQKEQYPDEGPLDDICKNTISVR
jgi:hypothetical protein